MTTKNLIALHAP